MVTVLPSDEKRCVNEVAIGEAYTDCVVGSPAKGATKEGNEAYHRGVSSCRKTLFWKVILSCSLCAMGGPLSDFFLNLSLRKRFFLGLKKFASPYSLVSGKETMRSTTIKSTWTVTSHIFGRGFFSSMVF